MKREPILPILMVMAVLSLNVLMQREIVPEVWPLSTWQMYSTKQHTREEVSYRRFLLHRADGSSTQTDLSDPVRFLLRPYRVDQGVARNLPLFLVTMLELGRTAEPNARGLSFERRRWNYREHSLKEHLKQPPVKAYIAMETPPVPVASPPTRARLRESFPIEHLHRRTGAPTGWQVSAMLGIGVDFASKNYSLALAVNPNQPLQSVERDVPLEAGDPPLVLQATVRTASRGARLELWHLSATGAIYSQAHVDCPADATWHRLRLVHSASFQEGDRLRVRLVGENLTDLVFFDDVYLGSE